MDTFKTYLKFQGQLFVYGIVGPIFLLIYFSAHPNYDMKWMYWWGLLITAADVLIALRLTKSSTVENLRAGARNGQLFIRRNHQDGDS